jgi:YidC/Oxa1 family membrane protein insertase
MDFSAITYSFFIPLLNSIHEMTQNFGLQSFGWSIVLLTAIVKLALTPLTYKQIKSTKMMQMIQPKMKELQDKMKKAEAKYKDNPEKLKEVRIKSQQEMMDFYKENNVNPLGGCLPLIVQMPILIGLFWTFSGAPFKASPIYVELKVVSQAEAHKKEIKAASKAEIFVDAEGKRARINANTKGLTLVEGESFDLYTTKIMGDADYNPEKTLWQFFGDKTNSEIASISKNPDGTATVTALQPGSLKIEALLPATLKNDTFFFIEDFGDTGILDAKTGKLNLDILILVAVFGLSIWLSSKLNSPKIEPPKPGEIEDPQIAMQRSMSTMMPIMMTVMMLFIPLPAGAFLYMIVSSFIQSAQTYFAQKHYAKLSL